MTTAINLTSDKTHQMSELTKAFDDARDQRDTAARIIATWIAVTATTHPDLYAQLTTIFPGLTTQVERFERNTAQIYAAAEALKALL